MRKLVTCLAALAICGVAYSEGLKRAEVTSVVNEVSIKDPQAGTRPAKIKDTVTGKTAVNTGVKSRAELLFDDKTLARLGANTIFSFEEGTRSMDLQKGTMLLQVPKGAGGATIRTAAVTAAITGTTIMIDYQPGQLAKVIVLEGTLRLYLNGQTGESILIKPGQMIFMDPKSTKLPEPVDVDLQTLVGTSGLVQGVGGGSRGNLDMSPIGQQIALQQGDNQFLLFGRGTETTLGVNELMSAIDQAIQANNNAHNTCSGGNQIIEGGGEFSVGY